MGLIRSGRRVLGLHFPYTYALSSVSSWVVIGIRVFFASERDFIDRSGRLLIFRVFLIRRGSGLMGQGRRAFYSEAYGRLITLLYRSRGHDGAHHHLIRQIEVGTLVVPYTTTLAFGLDLHVVSCIRHRTYGQRTQQYGRDNSKITLHQGGLVTLRRHVRVRRALVGGSAEDVILHCVHSGLTRRHDLWVLLLLRHVDEAITIRCNVQIMFHETGGRQQRAVIILKGTSYLVTRDVGGSIFVSTIIIPIGLRVYLMGFCFL